MRRVDAYVPPDLGEAPESTTEFVPHDEAQLLEAALAISSTDDDDDWRASLRRKAPRMALDATTLKNLEVLKSSAPDGWSGSLWHLYASLSHGLWRSLAQGLAVAAVT